MYKLLNDLINIFFHFLFIYAKGKFINRRKLNDTDPITK